MKKVQLIFVFALCAIILLASCATKAEKTEPIPAAPATTTAPAAEKAPAAAPAPTAAPKQESSSKTVIAVTGTMPAAAPASAPAKELTLSEKIDNLSEKTTYAQANEVVTALFDPANDPDGSLTKKALAKAEILATQILKGNNESLKKDLFAYAQQTAQKAIDSTYSVDTLAYYKQLLQNVQNAYGSVVDTKALIAQADERAVAIEAYYKNSIYTYIRKYPKGQYVKELAAMLTKYPPVKTAK